MIKVAAIRMQQFGVQFYQASLTAADIDKLVRKLLAGYLIPLKTEQPTIARRFGHLFSNPVGYAAGYYSYKWAEVLSADAYALFEEMGVLNPEAGRRFRDEILAVGGSRPASDSFKAFRGREPRIDALLRHSGMLAGE